MSLKKFNLYKNAFNLYVTCPLYKDREKKDLIRRNQSLWFKPLILWPDWPRLDRVKGYALDHLGGLNLLNLRDEWDGVVRYTETHWEPGKDSKMNTKLFTLPTTVLG